MMIWKLACLLLAIPGVSAAAVYKCVDSKGVATFTEKPCAPDAEPLKIRDDYLGGSPIPVEPTPKPREDETPVQSPTVIRVQMTQRSRDLVSYKCSTPDGVVFYRHSECPRNIAVFSPGTVGGMAASIRVYAPVEQVEVSRKFACTQIYGPDAEKRSGRHEDEKYSTYDRNLGRDPCRK